MEILWYDYGEVAGLATKNEWLRPRAFKQRARRAGDTFYEWLESELYGNARYRFFKTERHLIVHRGEPPKSVHVALHESFGNSVTPPKLQAWFLGWDTERIDVACRGMIAFANQVISQAKVREPRLGS